MAHSTSWKRFASVDPDPKRVCGLGADHPAVIEGRTLFRKSVGTAVTESDRVLISGHNSRKLGKSITRGPWAGMPIFSVTLEERATCPHSCHHWRTCYGNAMPFARRHRPGYLLEAAIIHDVAALLRKHGSIAVRLHQLGDFYALHYVHMWAQLTFDFPGLHCFGFTAHAEDSEIGEAIRDLYEASEGRFYIRFSSTKPGPRHAVTINRKAEGSKVTEGTVCPAQYGKTEGCGACGFCFDPRFDDRTVVFIQHGMKGGKTGPRKRGRPPGTGRPIRHAVKKRKENQEPEPVQMARGVTLVRSVQTQERFTWTPQDAAEAA